jgi:O-antigen ligase
MQLHRRHPRAENRTSGCQVPPRTFYHRTWPQTGLRDEAVAEFDRPNETVDWKTPAVLDAYRKKGHTKKDEKMTRGVEHSHTKTQNNAAYWSERLALWFLIAILAWVQFPLGSNRGWSWSLLVILISIAWLIWIPAGLPDMENAARATRRVAIPAICLVAVLLWAWIQCQSFTPVAWHNPVWSSSASVLGHQIVGAISVNPYASGTEMMKLESYVALGWLGLLLASKQENARLLMVAIFIIGVAYAIYGLALDAFGLNQLMLLEKTGYAYKGYVSGGFVNKNNFATFTGMALLVGCALIIQSGRHQIVTHRGWRTHLRTLLQFAVGKGAGRLIGVSILVSALIASNSRAGLIATLVGLFAMFIVSVIISVRQHSLTWTLAGGVATTSAIILLFLINGQNLQSRFDNLTGIDESTSLRLVMWSDAVRALADRPVLGTGLGTFDEGYPRYADRFVPYVVDKVHNDYLELALGLGIPAAALWVLALAALTWQCLAAALRPSRRRIYASAAVGASSLVAFHSAFDFSLQIPAVSALYALILGIGLARSRPNANGVLRSSVSRLYPSTI